MKPGDEWRILRWGIVLNFIGAMIWAGAADYPDGLMIWQLVGPEGAYWLWEMMILFVGMVLAVEWTFRVEERQIRVTRKRRLRA